MDIEWAALKVFAPNSELLLQNMVIECGTLPGGTFRQASISRSRSLSYPHDLAETAAQWSGCQAGVIVLPQSRQTCLLRALRLHALHPQLRQVRAAVPSELPDQCGHFLIAVCWCTLVARGSRLQHTVQVWQLRDGSCCSQAAVRVLACGSLVQAVDG